MTYLKPPDSNTVDETQLPPEDQFKSDSSLDEHPIVKPIQTFPEKRQPWTLIAGSVILALGIGFAGGQSWDFWKTLLQPAPSEAQEERPPSPVKFLSLTPTTVQETSAFVGNLEAKRAVQIQSELEGRVIEIRVQPGDFVQRGDVIARIKSDDVEAQLKQAQARLIGARAKLAELQAGTRPESINAAQARLQQVQARLAELQAGTRQEEIAKARATLLEAQGELADTQSGSWLEEINQAKAQIVAAEADADLAQQRVERYENLNTEGAISQDAYDKLVSDNRSMQAKVEEGKRRLQQLEERRKSEIQRRQAVVAQEQQALNQLENGARPEEIAHAQAMVAEARSQLTELLNGSRPEEVAQAEAEVAEAVAAVRSAEIELQDTLIMAPFGGMIGDVPIKVGDVLSKGDAITSLTENQVLDLHLAIPLERESQLKIGLPVQMSDPQGKSLGTGKISFISPTVNNDSQTVLAKATFENTTGQLRNSQFVTAKVIWNQRPEQVKVPMTAVIFQGEKRFVFIAEEKEGQFVAKRVPVELGLIEGDHGEIVKGVQPGQKLIVSGIQKLSDGAPVIDQEGKTEGLRGN